MSFPASLSLPLKSTKGGTAGYSAPRPASCQCLGRQQMLPKVLGSPGWSFRFMASGWSSPSYYRHLNNEPKMEDLSLSFPICYSAFQINKYTLRKAHANYILITNKKNLIILVILALVLCWWHLGIKGSLAHIPETLSTWEDSHLWGRESRWKEPGLWLFSKWGWLHPLCFAFQPT